MSYYGVVGFNLFPSFFRILDIGSELFVVGMTSGVFK